MRREFEMHTPTTPTSHLRGSSSLGDVTTHYSLYLVLTLLTLLSSLSSSQARHHSNPVESQEGSANRASSQYCACLRRVSVIEEKKFSISLNTSRVLSHYSLYSTSFLFFFVFLSYCYTIQQPKLSLLF